MPDNSSLAPPSAVNAGPPGSGADNVSLGGHERASEPLTGIRRGGDLAASRIAARQKTLVTTEQLVACGVARLAEVLGDEDATTITRSRAERAFRKLIRDARLPPRRSTSRSGGTYRTSCGASSD